MAEIKRPNYFTGQFLLEGDFKDEQAYHLDMRRRLNRGLHTPGVAEGFELTYVNEVEIQVSPGIAIDKDGREIVLEQAQIYRLTSLGSRNALVILTAKYHEEPVDRYNQGGIDKFKRTAERALLLDGTEEPPVDGSVIVLGVVLLNSAGVIESSGSIWPYRLFAGARLAPESVGETHLADRAVTLRKLAHEALPWTMQGTNAITVTPNDAQRTVTVGETHSARTDNPHATTAHQIDTQGGTNRIVTQINAGTGIIARSRVETSMVTGVVTFTSLGAYDQSSAEIDAGLGEGPICVQLALDEAPRPGATLSGDYTPPRNVLYRAELNRTTGRFRIFARFNVVTSAPVSVRWYAFKAVPGVDSTVTVEFGVTPASVSLPAGATREFRTNVVNSDTKTATWRIEEANGGSLNTVNIVEAVTYTAPATPGTYHLRATCMADNAKSATATINVTAGIAVNMSQSRVDELLTGGQVTLSASVINTADTRIEWSILQGSAGGTLTTNSDGSKRYTAPATAGTYTVVAKSGADPSKTATCSITVYAPSIAISADRTTLAAGGSTTIRATVSPASAHQGVNWTKTGPGTLSALGLTATYTAPSSTSGTSVTIRATRAADSTQFREVTLTVNGTGGGGSDPDPGPNPGGGKFAAVGPVENVTPPGPMPPDETELSALAPESDATERTFVRPQKRTKAKSSKRDDE